MPPSLDIVLFHVHISSTQSLSDIHKHTQVGP